MEIHEICDIPFERPVNEVLWFFIMKSYGGGTSNLDSEIFSIKPYDWGEEENINDWHFWHKPSGFKLCWYKYPLRDACVNMNIDHEQFYAILQDSMNSVRGYRDCTFTAWWESDREG